MQKRDFLYEGKAKQVYTTDDPNLIIIRYKDDATAFNNLKKGTIQDKGIMNNQITTRLFELLHENGIKTHFHQRLNEREQLCDRVNIIPLEVITRNLIAGSMAKRLNIVEGTKPANLVMELSYKDDALGDLPQRDAQRVRGLLRGAGAAGGERHAIDRIDETVGTLGEVEGGGHGGGSLSPVVRPSKLRRKRNLRVFRTICQSYI